jgi:hypothetical protein
MLVNNTLLFGVTGVVVLHGYPGRQPPPPGFSGSGVVGMVVDPVAIAVPAILVCAAVNVVFPVTVIG